MSMPDGIRPGKLPPKGELACPKTQRSLGMNHLKAPSHSRFTEGFGSGDEFGQGAVEPNDPTSLSKKPVKSGHQSGPDEPDIIKRYGRKDVQEPDTNSGCIIQ